MNTLFLASNITKYKPPPPIIEKTKQLQPILDKNGIIPFLKGGLGNQMFIIASAYSVHRYLNCELYILNNPPSKHNHLKNNYNNSIFKFIGNHNRRNQSDENYITYLLDQGYKFSTTSYNSRINNTYTPWNYKEISKKTIMANYYQYYPCIKPYKQDIQNLFLKGLNQYINQVKSKFENLNNCAFLHVRRGDYLLISSYNVLPISYYEQSYKLLLEKKSIDKIFIISDDFNWVKQQEFFINIQNKEYYDCNNELEVLSLMTLCEAGSICANSTFSWWGAFLGAYRFNNPVFVPKNWCAEKNINLFPETWNIIQ